MSDDKPSNKISIFRKILDQHKPREEVTEIKLESMTESIDDLIMKAKGLMTEYE